MNRIIRSARREDGAAAVEFALIAGVLVMLIFGMLQFGVAFFELQNLRAAVREGARIGAVGADDDEVRQRVSDLTANQIPPSAAVITVSRTCAGETFDGTVAVSIDTTNPALPPAVQDIFSLDIPFMAPIQIDAPVHGEFRCETE